jgi:TonB family protein
MIADAPSAAPTPPPYATSCPSAPASVAVLVRPTSAQKYLQANHKSGVVDVKVYLDRDGSVTKAVIVRSSGDSFLDGATYDAAVATTYTPETRDCETVAGAYIYRAKYNAGPVPSDSPAPALTPAPTPTPAPTAAVTSVPTTYPTTVATTIATTVPTMVPTTVATMVPTTAATMVPTTVPTTIATTVPTSVPTTVETTAPAKSASLGVGAPAAPRS